MSVLHGFPAWLPLLLGGWMTLIAAIGLAVIGRQAFALLGARRRIEGWARVPGTVVTMAQEVWPEGSRTSPRVVAYYRWTDAASGRELQGKDILPRTEAGPGTPVVVALDPLNPGGSRIDRLAGAGAAATVGVVVGAVAVVILAVVLVNGLGMVLPALR